MQNFGKTKKLPLNIDLCTNILTQNGGKVQDGVLRMYVCKNI